MIKVNNQAVIIAKNSLNISDAIEERTTCSFTVIDSEGAFYFEKGHPVEVFDHENILIFSGVVDKPVRNKFGPSNTFYHSLQCIDWHYFADKRRYAAGHENMLAGNIVRSILQSKLAEEGIIEGLIEDGPLIIEARFNYSRITDCLNSLAEKAGFWWKIDQYKKLHFVSKITYASPFTITNDDMERGSIVLENGNPKYRNRQYIKGGTDITDPQTEIKVGDGESQSFVVGFRVAKVPTVEISLNGGAWQIQSVGIRGIDENKQWYWSKGSNVISQDDNSTPLTKDVDLIRITYQGEFDIVVLSEIPGEIDDRKTVEGGTGIVEDVEDNMDITSRESAFQLANAKLEKYGVIGRRLRFKTWLKGLEIGQLLKVTIPYHDLNETEMLVESISITKQDEMFWYNVTCVEGPVNGSWAKMFYHMATRGEAFVIRENIREDQILIVLSTFSKTWVQSENPNIFRSTFPGDTTIPSSSTFPMYRDQDKVKYVSWFNDETELGRKAITKQTGTSTSEINSTSYLAPFEANETITHIGWFGGWQATAQLGTGVLVDKQVYDKVKTSLEAIQIDKKDTKGW